MLSNFVLKEIDGEYIEMLQPLLERFTCRAGDVVIEQGTVVDFLYLVESGKVAISYKPYDGESITITHVEANGLFGWSAVIGSTHYTSSVTAIEDLVAVRIHGNDLRKLCKENPDAGRVILDRLANVVSARWKNAHEQVKTLLQNGMNAE
jgi:CRP-like cAMP-binding protein